MGNLRTLIISVIFLASGHLRAQSTTEIVLISPNPPSDDFTASNSEDADVNGDSNNNALSSRLEGTLGSNNSSGDGTNGGNTGALNITNNGSLTMTNGNFGNHRGFFVFSLGGEGGDATNTDGKDNGGFAGNSGNISLTNNAPVSLFGSFAQNASVIAAASTGGEGGSSTSRGTDGNNNPTFDGGLGRPGGNAGNISISNSAALQIGTSSSPANIPLSASGMSLGNAGGQAGIGQEGTIGGNAGNLTASTSASIDLYLTGANQSLYGLQLHSQGGLAAASYQSKYNGGAGGNSGGSSVNLPTGGSINLVSASSQSGAGIYIDSIGGKGGSAYDTSNGGTGGTQQTMTVGSITASTFIDINGGSISTTGNNLAGILIRNTGGEGGAGGLGQDHSNGGAGGAGGSVNISTSGSNSGTIVTAGINSPVINSLSQGGTGGQGTDYDNPFLGVGQAGNGGTGGAGGNYNVTIGSGLYKTYNEGSLAFLLRSEGGDGGRGGNITGDWSIVSVGSIGGAGGTGGAITMELESGAGIVTIGDQSTGIQLVSSGGVGGAAGTINSQADSGQVGGAGGNSGDIELTLDAGSSIVTAGDGSFGIVVQSLSGSGGVGGSVDNNFGGSSGVGGSGGSTGTILIQHNGGIATGGTAATGILAQASSGAGGAAGSAEAFFYASGANGGSAGSVGLITVNLNGSIDTLGDNAHGVHMQSVNGGGGAAGSTVSVVTVGGNSTTNPLTSNGGDLQLNSAQYTYVYTEGTGAISALAQSVGGGGGDAGSSAGWISVGGSGGQGGAGGTVNVDLTDGGILLTSGQLSHAVVGQSIGGGGGTAGNATSLGFEVAVGIGGTGGSGGNGGTVTINSGSGAEIGTAGSNSIGLVGQSIGGGGGNGGSSYTTSGGIGFAAAVGVGGSGGSGGGGGTVTFNLANTAIVTGDYSVFPAAKQPPANELPVDSFGILGQSIGGGGGNGGSASAQALAAAIPIPDTDTMVSASATATVGGNGGSGGAGGEVNVFLADGVKLLTQGQGSHGIVAQSIGGGGGTGGDSSSMAATLGYKIDPEFSLSLDLSFSLGGTGGSGGNAGMVEVALGGTSLSQQNGTSTIATYGDFSNGILAQSIAGGGGNAGMGSSNTGDRGSTVNVGLSATLGSSGGVGGSATWNGSQYEGPSVTIYEGSSITTYGSGSHGIVAQAISGGGGTSQGGTLDLSASGSTGGDDDGGDEGEEDDETDLSGTISISLGKQGAGGGQAGQVTIVNNGALTTYGEDASAILAQSIAGGGGLGGNAGSDASADNPVNAETGTRGGASDDEDDDDGDGDSYSATLSLAVGGGGGNGGTAGTIDITHNGTIQTVGDWSSGIIAQSIGGGGGKGGTAVTDTSNSTPTINIGLAAGGKGGPGGSGGVINLTLGEDSVIATQGYAAVGILAQSIGGGGGIGADGSASSTGTISVGADDEGHGGTGGSGGAVNLDNSTLNITTLGEAAHGVVLQSIGAGGGFAGQGSTSISGSLNSSSTDVNIQVGGAGGVSGSGGAINVDTLVKQIRTSGNNAFGFIAQSIGGGGGIGWSQLGGRNGFSLGGYNSVSGNGSDLAIALEGTGPGPHIATSGNGAHGVVLQSIGGGGGIANYLNTDLTGISVVPGERGYSTGDGGGINFGTGNGEGLDITTTGNNAFGILVQSLSGGGGIVNGSLMGPQNPNAGGSGESIGIYYAGNMNVSGQNSAGIFAQSNNGGQIAVEIYQNVSGGSGEQGYGIWVDGGNPANYIYVGEGAKLSALSGNAINFTGNSTITVKNFGTITGNVDVTNDAGELGTIQNSGTISPAPAAQTAAQARDGARRPAFSKTTLGGNFVQSKEGKLVVGIDFQRERGDQFLITGDADLDGKIVTHNSNVDPYARIPVLKVQGEVTGELDAEVIGANTTVYRFGLERQGKQFLFGAVGAEFDMISLKKNPQFVAQNLNSVFISDESATFRPLFDVLDATIAVDPARYREYLAQLSPGVTLGFAARQASDMQAYASQLIHTPEVEETSGSWARTSGQYAAKNGNLGLSDFAISQSFTEVGGQFEVSDGWFVGGSLGYRYSWLSADDGLASGNGHGAFGAFTVKHQRGAWRFTAGAYGSFGYFETTRKFTIPGFNGEAEGSPAVQSAGLLLSADYTFRGDNWYLQPSLTLNTIYVHANGYNETGGGLLNLRVDSADELTLVASPAVEFGYSAPLSNGWNLRPFVRTGLDLFTDTDWDQNAGFRAAGSDFNTIIPTDTVVGRITAGVDLAAGENWNIGLQYEGEFSEHVLANGGQLRVGFRF